MTSDRSSRRCLAALLATLVALLALTAGGPAAARPAPPRPVAHPGGLLPGGRVPASEHIDETGDCNLANVTCKPDRSGSCSGDTSQTTFPSTIVVLVRTPHTGTFTLRSVTFETYVENVLPNEWIPSWDGDALKAGAVAIKSYAWYWHTHFGGYVNGKPSECFDVTDDTSFQVYKAGSATSRTTSAVQESWPVVARENGSVLQASYQAFLSSSGEHCGAHATGDELSQWGTQNCVEENTGNKFNVILGKYYYPGLQLATARQLRTPDDFSFEQSSSRAFFHSGSWTLSDGYGTSFHFGQAGDIPTVRDDGDGFAHLGVFRPSTGNWIEATPTDGVESTVHLGRSGDVPVQAHYNGVNQPTEPAVWRPSSGYWYVGSTSDAVKFGREGDIPVPGHYTGSSANDYADTIAIFRPSSGNWYIDGSSTGIKLGRQGDIPVPADYDGNGTTDVAIYRPSSHTFYVRHADGTITSQHLGENGDIPVSGDYDGNGKADYAVYRPGSHTWYSIGASGQVVGHVFGQASGQPIGKAPQHG